MKDTGDILSAASTYIVQSMFLSGYILLRLLKTTLAKHVDVPSGQALFLSSVRLLEKVSVANNNFPAKCANILSMLWRSEKVFNRSDGSQMQGLRLCSRPNMILIFD